MRRFLGCLFRKESKILLYLCFVLIHLIRIQMKNKKETMMTLDQFIEEHYGKVGTPKRDKLEKGYEKFKKQYLKKHNL